MSEFPLDDASSEINRLWAKVAASSSEPEAYKTIEAGNSEGGKQLVWEAVSLLKRRHNQDENYWAEVLAAKERALTSSKERQAKLEIELNTLRARLQIEDSAKLQETSELEARMRAIFESLNEERKRFDYETRTLRALLEQTRQRLTSDTARARNERQAWEHKEQQYLLDIAELQSMATRLQKESTEASQKSLAFSNGMKEAKNAIEKTLSELLRERQLREQTEREKSEALRKVGEVENHFSELSKIWEEERAQWRELWDRERSTWESQRAEFSTWEEKLRQERQAWLAEVQSKEQDQLKFTEHLTQKLRESTEITSRMTTVLKSIRWIPFTTSVLWRSVAVTAVIACVLYPSWRYFSRYHFREASAVVLPAGNPTALAYDGSLLWTAEWDGTLKAFDPKNAQTPIKEVHVGAMAPYRPVALAFDGEYFWSADSAQARILRHRAARPEEIVSTRPSPGPAPTALAYDGQSLWSYDAANKAIYRHGLDEASAKSYALDPELVVTAMSWVRGDLWVFDSKSRGLLIFQFKNENFRFKDRYALGLSAVGIAAGSLTEGRGKRQLWILAPSEHGEQLERLSF